LGDPVTVTLTDCSQVTYHWYRFIDQPVFQQYTWTANQRDALQEAIEAIHVSWSIDRTYLPNPTDGTLATFDPNLIVTPPEGLEVGYVPIVVHQEASTTGQCAQREEEENEPTLEDWARIEPQDLVGTYIKQPRENDWHEGQLSLVGDRYQWTNDAGASWTLDNNIAQGRLTSGEDNPYWGTFDDPDFVFILQQNQMGEYQNILGFKFGFDVFYLQRD
jgi:hypothetical protein